MKLITLYNFFAKIFKRFSFSPIKHDLPCSVTLHGKVSLLDPFTHSKLDHEKILNFDFIKDNSTKKRERVMIDQTFCTLVAVGGKFLEKKIFEKVLQKIDEIRKIIWM